MSFKLKIDTKQLKNFEKKLQNVPPSLPKFVRQGVQQKAIEIKEVARDIVPKDTGRLKNSIQEFDNSNKKRIKFLIKPQERYAEGIEKGRPPHQPNMKNLKKWAKRKGLNPYAVANVIRKKGTRKQPYMKPAFNKVKNSISPFIEEIISNFFKKYL